MEKDERRLSRRVPLDIWVEEIGEDTVYFYRTEDISLGGISFKQTIPHPVGTELNLKFKLPNMDKEMIVVGKVVNIKKDDESIGMGVKFIKLPEDVIRAIEEYIESMI